MGFRFSRRSMMQGVGGAALAQSLATAEAAPAPRKWPIEEGPATPKICLAPGDGGGPLPAGMQPPVPSAAAPGATAAGAAGPGAAAGRGGRGGGVGGGYGGVLRPQTEPAPPRPRPPARGGGVPPPQPGPPPGPHPPMRLDGEAEAVSAAIRAPAISASGNLA